MLPLADPRTLDFVRSFSAIQQAYAEGAMGYGMFAAKRSPTNGRDQGVGNKSRQQD